MRPATIPLALSALFFAPSAYADCIGPLECFCSSTSTTTTPVAIGVVTAERSDDEVRRVDIAVESVHLGPGAATEVEAGAVLSTFAPEDVEAGDRLLFDLDPEGEARPYGLVRERDDGSVECSGFSSADLALTDIVEVRTSSDCYARLGAKDVEYEVPECNDTIEGPFGCDATGGEGAAGLAALALLFAGRRRRRG